MINLFLSIIIVRAIMKARLHPFSGKISELSKSSTPAVRRKEFLKIRSVQLNLRKGQNLAITFSKRNVSRETVIRKEPVIKGTNLNSSV